MSTRRAKVAGRQAAGRSDGEMPAALDRAGRQRGMIIILAVGGLFWAGVAGLVVFLLR